ELVGRRVIDRARRRRGRRHLLGRRRRRAAAAAGEQRGERRDEERPTLHHSMMVAHESMRRAVRGARRFRLWMPVKVSVFTLLLAVTPARGPFCHTSWYVPLSVLLT